MNYLASPLVSCHWLSRAGTSSRLPHGVLASPLVSCHWLREHLLLPDLVIVDCRWYLSDFNKGRQQYLLGHLPNAVFADIQTELAEFPGPGRHPLPSPASFQQVVQRCGIHRKSTVVAYDDAGGAVAARLWWLLEYFGHASAAVLDGGISAWIDAGGAIESQVPSPTPGDFIPKPSQNRHVGRKEVAGRDANVLLIDARAPERYRGEVEPVDARAGHIPGAVNVPFSSNLEQGKFKDAKALRQLFQEAGADGAASIIVYCGSGVTACHDLLALRLAGFSNAVLYEGSWSEWSADPSSPIATGDKP